MQFWQEYQRSEAVFFSVNPIRRHIVSLCLLSGDDNFDHLVKVVSARFLHDNATILFLVINKYLMERHIEVIQYPVTPQTFTY